MQLIRGTTPTVVITVTNDVDLANVSQVWVYLAQQNKPKVFKDISDVTIDTEAKTFTTLLSQADTLELRAGDCFFQMRVLLSDGTALATVATKLTVIDVYKGGEIKSGDNN